MARKALPVIVATHKMRAQPKMWHDFLDEAINARYQNVRAQTYLTRSGMATKIEMRDGSKLAPALNNRISHFIAGWMANENE